MNIIAKTNRGMKRTVLAGVLAVLFCLPAQAGLITTTYTASPNAPIPQSGVTYSAENFSSGNDLSIINVNLVLTFDYNLEQFNKHCSQWVAFASFPLNLTFSPGRRHSR